MGEGRKKITVAEYTGGRRATQVGRSSTINPKVKVGVAPSMVAEKVKVGITPSMVSEKVKVLKTILFILSNLFNSIVSFTGWESIAGNRYTTDLAENGKKILHFYGFEKRTAVDLKDKWTNILKSEAKQTTANETFANRCFFSAD
ncbi:hypothetical protein QL285_057845 [Trifolium repens]|nr:hypothetical protein QL285_057845 [Trifolium repens]